MTTELVLAPVAATPLTEKQERKASPPLPNCSVAPLITVMLVSAAAIRTSIVRVDEL